MGGSSAGRRRGRAELHSRHSASPPRRCCSASSRRVGGGRGSRRVLGWVVDAFAWLGLPLSAWLLLDGQSPRSTSAHRRRPPGRCSACRGSRHPRAWRRVLSPGRAPAVRRDLPLGPDVPVVAPVEHRARRLGGPPPALRAEHGPQHPRLFRRRIEQPGRDVAVTRAGRSRVRIRARLRPGWARPGGIVGWS